MQFSNKLNFLMNITNTSNKELAEGISVDRSLISLLRSGKRKTPRNHDHIRNMASFFARRCSADFQFHALAEMLEKPELRSHMPTETLVGYLYQWMRGDTPRTGTGTGKYRPDPTGSRSAIRRSSYISSNTRRRTNTVFLR